MALAQSHRGISGNSVGHTWKGSCQGWPSRDLHFRVLLLLTRYIGKVDSRGPGGSAHKGTQVLAGGSKTDRGGCAWAGL